jgi:hypothetical protein
VPARQVRGGGVETALSYTECMEKWGGASPLTANTVYCVLYNPEK